MLKSWIFFQSKGNLSLSIIYEGRSAVRHNLEITRSSELRLCQTTLLGLLISNLGVSLTLAPSFFLFWLVFSGHNCDLKIMTLKIMVIIMSPKLWPEKKRWKKEEGGAKSQGNTQLSTQKPETRRLAKSELRAPCSFQVMANGGSAFINNR